MAFPRAEICQLLFVLGEYEQSEFDFLSTFLAPGMTVVDVGANIGLYSLFAASRVRGTGTVVAFEPSSREYQRLEANVMLNGFSNIKTYRLGLSDDPQTMNLAVADDIHSGHNTFGRFAYAADVQIESIERVETRRLDDVIRDLGLRRVDLIKIDVEGHERAVLRGAVETIRTFRPLLLVELLDSALVSQGSSTDDIRSLLGELRYELHELSPKDGPAKDGESSNGPNILAIPVEKEQDAKSLAIELSVS